MQDPLVELDRGWPPIRHIEAGWDRLGRDQRERVIRRLDLALDRYDPPDATNEVALRRFFSFLAHMETIAIELPLRSLGRDGNARVDLLVHQLADEVFHATLFGRIATRHGGLEPPIQRAEAMLDRLRAPDDPRVTHVLLNRIAEAWFETLFEHASTWGVADEIFRIALTDEQRHVDEGVIHAGDVTPEQIEPAVRTFEDELFRLVQDPRLVLPTLALAGEEDFRALSEAYLATHEDALAHLGLPPRDGFDDLVATLEELRAGDDPLSHLHASRRIEPETQWRETALHLWDAPRDPVMYGWFDIETDHIPDAQLTAIMVAAVGQVWDEYPRVNRYTLGGKIYEPRSVNVGVRVSLGAQQEALSTVVVPDANERSPRDIERILELGVDQLNELGDTLGDIDPESDPGTVRELLDDTELMGLLPPDAVAAPVTVSNVGPSGLVAGVGAMPGVLGQSVEIVVGRVEQRPVWNGERYVPGDVATVGAAADHRVMDGHHTGQAMDRLREALAEDGVDEFLAREDTLSPEPELSDVALPGFGFDQRQAQLMLSCKVPFLPDWLCWAFKK